MAISKIPQPSQPGQPPKPVSEKEIQAFINKGGKPTSGSEAASDPDAIKGFKISLKASEVDAIKELRDKRPVSRSRKIPISIHDWVIEAVQEKIMRERKLYGLRSK